ncbi:MAG: hypothetical protein ACPLXM_09200 [Bacteroidales bacterium]
MTTGFVGRIGLYPEADGKIMGIDKLISVGNLNNTCGTIERGCFSGSSITRIDVRNIDNTIGFCVPCSDIIVGIVLKTPVSNLAGGYKCSFRSK